MIENLFVIFAPGLGGNHLANLIGLSSRFTRHADFEKYQPGIKTAHITNIMNLQEKLLLDNLPQLQNQSNVLCGHLAEYLWIQQKKIDKFFTNRKFLIVTFPEKFSAAYDRLLKCCPYMIRDYWFYEQRSLYSIQYLEKLFDEHDFFTINAQDIFTENVDQIVKFIESELHAQIDINLTQKLHTIWYKSITG